MSAGSNSNLARLSISHQIQKTVHNADLFHLAMQSSHPLYKKDLLMEDYGRICAFEFSPNGSFFVTGGDNVLVWNVANALSNGYHEPKIMEYHGNYDEDRPISSIAVTRDSSKLLSESRDDDLGVVVHDISTGDVVDHVLIGREAHGSDDGSDGEDGFFRRKVCDLAASPSNKHLFASAGFDYKVRIHDIRQRDSGCVKIFARESMYGFGFRASFSSIHFSPAAGHILATGNHSSGAQLWDLRAPKKCLQQHLDSYDVTTVRISQNGRKLMCLTHNDSPYIYDLLHQQHYGVRLKATKFRNRYDNRTSCFAGAGDEYVVCISDDRNFYIWKLPLLDCHDSNFDVVHDPHAILKGCDPEDCHVRYNASTCTLASFGGQDILRLWSPVVLHDSTEWTLLDLVQSPFSNSGDSDADSNSDF